MLLKQSQPILRIIEQAFLTYRKYYSILSFPRKFFELLLCGLSTDNTLTSYVNDSAADSPSICPQSHFCGCGKNTMTNTTSRRRNLFQLIIPSYGQLLWGRDSDRSLVHCQEQREVSACMLAHCLLSFLCSALLFQS